MTRDREPWDDADVASLFTRADGVAAPCPAPELLSAARAGTLPPDSQAAVSAHLDACIVCRLLADALDDDTVTMLQADESQRILDRIRSSTTGVRHWRRTAVQGALLAAAVLLVVTAVWRSLRPTSGTPSVHVPQFELASAPILPSDAQSPLAADRRGVDERVDLLQALVPYREGDYARAASELAAVIARRPQSAAGHFYLGVSELMRGNHARAITALQTASRLETAGTADAREMLWYLAVAHYRAGAAHLAAAPLQRLCSGGGNRADPACTALRTLLGRRTLRVTVTDTAGTPLSGVLVGEHAMSRLPSLILFSFTAFSGRTDTTGRVEISGETVTMEEQLLVRAVKPGYFMSAGLLRPGVEMEHQFRLRPWVMTAVNQTIPRNHEAG